MVLQQVALKLQYPMLGGQLYASKLFCCSCPGAFFKLFCCSCPEVFFKLFCCFCPGCTSNCSVVLIQGRSPDDDENVNNVRAPLLGQRPHNQQGRQSGRPAHRHWPPSHHREPDTSGGSDSPGTTSESSVMLLTHIISSD